MNEQTLFNLCMCYINTTYLPVEDIVELCGYDSLDDKVVEKFTKVMEPVRDAWFDFIDNSDSTDDGDLERYAKVLTRNLEVLIRKMN